jgi:diguanylate cyclase (GGDEF)-like protein/PAS domain S-box-containing protein
MDVNISEHFDFERLNVLLEGFNQATGFVTAVLDLEGNVLSKSGWREVCTDFHRANKGPANNCKKSDTLLANEMSKGKAYYAYECLNGLIDVVVPIVIKGEHFANLFTGQFFFEEPSMDFFKKQARQYNFDESLYLSAVKKVPVVTEAKVKVTMEVLVQIIEMISDLTVEKIEQQKANSLLEISYEELKASKEKLKMEKEKLRITLHSIGDAVISTDIEGKIVRMNLVAEGLTGWDREDASGKPIQKVFNIINAKTRNKVENPVSKVLENGKIVGLANHTALIAKDGSEYQIADSAAPIINNEEDITGVVLVFRDVTEKYRMQEKLKESEKKYRQLFKIMTNGLALHEMIYNDEGEPVDYRFLDINPAFEKLTGLSSSNLIGNTVKEVLPETEQYWIDKYGNVATTGESISFEEYAKEQDKYYKVRAFSPEKGKFATIFSDITERKKAEEQLQYKTFHDELTGLYNRAYFNEEIKRYDNIRQLPLSIIMGDVNGLKIANDTFGHKEGDKLLKKIGQIIESSCRKEDLVARTGGDEFVVLLPQTTNKKAEKIYTRIKNNCQKAEECPIEPSIALGIATKKEITDDFEKLLKKAEDKMYQNKVHESKSVHNTILDSLETMLRETTNETLEHSQRLNDLAVRLGKRLDLTKHELDVLASLANLHDLGKITISKDILLKSGPLTDKEWEKVRRHPEAGYKIASSSPKLNDLAEGIFCHHERWDGDGYPQGLAGDEIPLLARIIIIVDAYDVMTNGRPYKEPMSKEEALVEIERCAGSQFDPELTEVFIKMLKEE